MRFTKLVALVFEYEVYIARVPRPTSVASFETSAIDELLDPRVRLPPVGLTLHTRDALVAHAHLNGALAIWELVATGFGEVSSVLPKKHLSRIAGGALEGVVITWQAANESITYLRYLTSKPSLAPLPPGVASGLALCCI